MRFISPAPGYQYIAHHQRIELLASGLPRIISPSVICEFKASDTTDWEHEIARRTFKFKGVPMGDGSGVLIDPVPSRVSSYDTDEDPRLKDDFFAKECGFKNAAELKARVEKRLLESQGPEDHIYVEKPLQPPPAGEPDEELVAA